MQKDTMHGIGCFLWYDKAKKKGVDAMEDRVTERVTPIYMDVIWIVLKAVVGFAVIRILTRGIKIFPGVYGDVFSVALFTWWMFCCVRGWAKAEGYTLEACRVTKPAMSWSDFAFVFGFLFIHYLLMSLTADRVFYTEMSLLDIIPLSMSGILHSGIGSGLNEELAFRGYLVKSLEDKVGITKAIVISSVVFGLIHMLNGGMTPWMMVWIAIGAGSLGAMFAVVTYKTGSIWRAVLAHACCNLGSLIVDYENGNCLFIIDFPAGMTGESIFCMSYAVISMLCMTVILGYWLKQKRRKNDSIE